MRALARSALALSTAPARSPPAPPPALPPAARGLSCRTSLTGVHRLFGARHVEALSAKPRGVDIGLGGDDHRVCGGNILWRQLVLSPDGTLSLHLDGVTQGFGSLFESCRCHKGVRNSGRARGDAHESFAARRGSRSTGGRWLSSSGCRCLFRCRHCRMLALRQRSPAEAMPTPTR